MARPSILVVDDHPTQQLMMRQLADVLQCEVTIVSSGREALVALHGERFDLVLMDWQMPELDGCECAREIRRGEAEHGLHTPIIAVTAHAYETDKQACLAAGMDDYLAKPFTLAELQEKIARWCKSCSDTPS